MKVNDPNLSRLSSTNVGGTKATETGQERGSKVNQKTSGGDQVSLSSLGSNLSTEATESPERAARIKQLTEDVAAGRYQVDAKEVSKKIIDDAITYKKP